MATKALFHRTLTGFAPSDPEAVAFMRAVPMGEHIWLEGTKPRSHRSVEHHRKFFAMLKIIFENQEHYPTLDALRAAVLVGIGHAEFVQTKHGLVGIPKSISFASVDQKEFNEIYDRCVDFVIEHVIPGLERSGLDAAVAEDLMRFAA